MINQISLLVPSHFAFSQTRLETWRSLSSPESRLVLLLLFLAYLNCTKPFRNRLKAFSSSWGTCGCWWVSCKTRASPVPSLIPWAVWCPDLWCTMSLASNWGSVNLHAQWVRVRHHSPALFSEAGDVKGRIQACSWADCPLGSFGPWAHKWDAPLKSDSSTDSSLSVCPAFSFSQPASLQREEKMIKRGRNRKPSYIFIWRRKFRSGPAIEAMNHGFNTIDIECMQMQIPLDRPTFWIPQDMFLGYPVLGMLPSLQGCSRKQDFNCTGVIRSLGNQITGLFM